MVAAEPGFVAATRDPLTMRAYGVFFATLNLLLQGGVTTVAEAAFGHRLWLQGLRPLTELADLRLIRCSVPAANARSRMQRRLDANPTRGAHADREHLAKPPNFAPLTLDSPTLDVRTSAGYDPELPRIVAFCRS